MILKSITWNVPFHHYDLLCSHLSLPLSKFFLASWTLGLLNPNFFFFSSHSWKSPHYVLPVLISSCLVLGMSGDMQLYFYWLTLLTVMSSMSSRLIASCIRIPSLCLHIPLHLYSIIYLSLAWFHILAVVHTDAVNMDVQILQGFWFQLFGIRSKRQSRVAGSHSDSAFVLWTKRYKLPFANEQLYISPNSTRTYDFLSFVKE